MMPTSSKESNRFVPDIEEIDSEKNDQDASPPGYDIVTYPADYTLEGIVSKFKKGLILIPGYQRNYVWSQRQASKLIESFLLGLPVPALFMYSNPRNNTLEVIDGQQRLMSVVYFFDGYFGLESKGKKSIFQLKLDEKSEYNSATYASLRDTDESSWNKLNDSVLRAFVVKQLDPKDDTSVFHIFERLNTGGTQLVGQEIRNCVYHGSLNDMLIRLNANSLWRKIYGKTEPDHRMRDVELILRYYALKYCIGEYKKPMKDFLSNYMASLRNPDDATIEAMEREYNTLVETIHSALGGKPFHIRSGLNAAVFDAVMVAFGLYANAIPNDIEERYNDLIADNGFIGLVRSATTDEEVVKSRISRALEVLFGEK